MNVELFSDAGSQNFLFNFYLRNLLIEKQFNIHTFNIFNIFTSLHCDLLNSEFRRLELFANREAIPMRC